MNCSKSLIDWLTYASLHTDCYRDWYSLDDLKRFATEALEVLKSQEPTLLSITDILETYPMCWFENRATHSGCYCQIMPAVIMNNRSKVIDVQVFGTGIQMVAFPSQYNQLWRCWTSRPTDEQREKVKWDGWNRNNKKCFGCSAACVRYLYTMAKAMKWDRFDRKTLVWKWRYAKKLWTGFRRCCVQFANK